MLPSYGLTYSNLAFMTFFLVFAYANLVYLVSRGAVLNYAQYKF